MSVARILLLVLALAAVAFTAKFVLTGSVGPDRPGPSEPKRQLDNVRQKAHDIEVQQQQSADRAEVPP